MYQQTSQLVMIGYIEHRYIVSMTIYQIVSTASISIFSTCRYAQLLFSIVDFIFLDFNASNEEFSYDRVDND